MGKNMLLKLAIFVLLGVCALAATDHECGIMFYDNYNESGSSYYYDLRPITSTSWNYTDPVNGASYAWNFCGPLLNDYSDDYIAVFKSKDNILTASSVVFITDKPRSPRTVFGYWLSIEFVCDPTAETPVISNGTSPYAYSLQMATKYACDLKYGGRYCFGGTYRINNDTCGPCGKGTYSNANDLTCSQCRPGTYNDQINSSYCQDCFEGYSSGEGAERCTPCNPGTYRDRFRSSTCVQCPAGSFTPYLGSASCSLCSPGYYSSQASTDCTRCPRNTFSSEGSNNCAVCPRFTRSEHGSSSCKLAWYYVFSFGVVVAVVTAAIVIVGGLALWKKLRKAEEKANKQAKLDEETKKDNKDNNKDNNNSNNNTVSVQVHGQSCA